MLRIKIRAHPRLSSIDEVSDGAIAVHWNPNAIHLYIYFAIVPTSGFACVGGYQGCRKSESTVLLTSIRVAMPSLTQTPRMYPFRDLNRHRQMQSNHTHTHRHHGTEQRKAYTMTRNTTTKEFGQSGTP
jgi:hypothetical protein